MPIYEFCCLDCNEVFEVLVMGSGGEEQIACPNCRQTHFERVLSSTSHQIRSGGNGVGPKVQNRVCTGGSCSTITLPGPD